MLGEETAVEFLNFCSLHGNVFRPPPPDIFSTATASTEASPGSPRSPCTRKCPDPQTHMRTPRSRSRTASLKVLTLSLLALHVKVEVGAYCSHDSIFICSHRWGDVRCRFPSPCTIPRVDSCSSPLTPGNRWFFTACEMTT
jgi:hypothetical protein